ncbi:hypothetical protein [Actinocrispum wychmicini]|uniref:Uncharacterized protein n=1 Tax=Actinocrispum wychmicini TaxID=1213861 RepID=A0A4R2JND1_9PSEU|nr:hypothetical protein [Actinocrispum wychmicini]TCO58646.1 hypothetical protein EV192_105717 [Actinocrispum wychmicini]
MPESAEHENGTPPREDVLAGPVPDQPRRAPRTSFHRKRDFVAVAVIVIVAVVGGVLIGSSSDISATTSQTASGDVEIPDPPSTLPPTFGEAWRAPSAATPVPAVAGATVVTGEGDEVLGRDALTGQVRWRYARNIPLCTVGVGWQDAIAVYRRTETLLPDKDSYHGGNCSEVTSLKGTTGERDHQRNGDAEPGTQLLYDGNHVTATGKRLINTWRNDMVLTVQYGTVPDPVNPDKQPRTDCEYSSIAVALGRVGVIERCRSKTDPRVIENDRLSVYKSVPKDADTPEVNFSVPTGGNGGRLVALTENYAAVASPNPDRLQVFDASGKLAAEYPLTLGATDLAGDPTAETVPVTKGTAEALFWFTGTRTIALSTKDLHPLWTFDDTLGSGAVFAGYLLLPVKDGLAVVDQIAGKQVVKAPVNRGDYTGPVEMSTVGPMVLEQRGPTLVALR